MNAPLPVLQTTPSALSSELAQLSTGTNRADDARTLRTRRADAAPRDRFSDLLKRASDRPSANSNESPAVAGSDPNQKTSDADRSRDGDAAGAAHPHSSQQDASTSRGGESNGKAGGEHVSSNTDGDASSKSNPSASAATVTVRDASSADHATNGPPVNAATKEQSAGVQSGGPVQQAPSPGNGDSQQAGPRASAHAAQAATAANERAGQQGAAARQQTSANASVTAAHATQQSQRAESGAVHTPRPDGQHSAQVDSNSTNTQSTAVSTPAAAQPSGSSATASNGDQQSQQRSANGSATQQLKQQIAQHAQQTGNDDDAETAALRRSQQVNAQVQAENTTGTRAVSLESLSSQTTVNGNTPPQPALDLGATARMTAQPVQTPGGQVVDQSQVTNSVMRGMSALVNQRGGVMHMRLEPPELGQLRVQMTIARGTVSAQFHAATAQAQQVLEQNMTTLRTALERHGLTVEKITVQTQQPAQSNNTSNQQMNHQNADQSGQNNQHDAGDGESRGRDDQQQGERDHRHDRGRQPFESFFEQQREQSFAESMDGEPENSVAAGATGVAS